MKIGLYNVCMCACVHACVHAHTRVHPNVYAIIYECNTYICTYTYVYHPIPKKTTNTLFFLAEGLVLFRSGDGEAFCDLKLLRRTEPGELEIRDGSSDFGVVRLGVLVRLQHTVH